MIEKNPNLNENAGRETNETPEILKGLFVDVEGTLIKDGALDKILVKKIESFNGPVTIFTDNNSPEYLSEQLRKLGFPEKFLPVVSKKDFRGEGKVLEYLIDDLSPSLQGLKVVNHSY